MFGRHVVRSVLGTTGSICLILAACAPAAPPASPTSGAAQSNAAAAQATTAPAAQPTSAPAAQVVPAAATAGGGKVTIAIGGDPTTLDPQAADDGNERAVNDNIYETLVARDHDMKLVPSLAEQWKQKDPSTWTFTIRKGVSFQNGEPFNAAAAAASIKRVIDPAFNSEQLSFYSTIKDARAVDDTTLDVVTDGPDPILPARLYWMKMVPPKHAGDADFGNAPVGTGPYQFVEWVKGQRVVLKANPNYWGTRPGVQDVVIRPIPEASTRLAALKAGEVDLIRNLLPEQTGQVPKTEKTPGVEFPIIRLNTRSGPLADPKVRQAMNYAVDKDGIVKALFGGNAVVAQGQVITPSHFGYDPAIQPYSYDVAKARDLLGGKTVEFELVSESGRWLKDKELTEAVAGQLEKVGFKPKVNIQEWNRYLDFLFSNDKQPDAIFVSTSNELFDADRNYSAYFSCKGRASSYCNDTVTSLLDKARTETDTAKREQMYHQALTTARDDAAVIFLVNYEDLYGLTQRLDWKARADGKILVSDMRVG